MFFTKLFPLFSFFVLPKRAALYLNDRELLIVKLSSLGGTSSLLSCNKLPDASE